MKIIQVLNKNELDMLYNNSAITLEGLNENDIDQFYNWVKSCGTNVKNDIVYKIKGKTLNEMLGLTDENMYNDNLTIVSIIYTELGSLIFKRFEIGARWFDDIIDNNLRRQGDIEYEL